MMLMK